MSGLKHKFCRPSDERALITYCIKDQKYYFDIISKITPDDFLLEAHRFIFLLLKELVNKNVNQFDASIIISEANLNGVLELIGGMDYVLTLTSMEVNSNNFNIHLESVVESISKYRLYKTLQDNCESVLENSKSNVKSNDLIGIAESSILDLSMNSLNVKDAVNLAEGIDEFIETMREQIIDLSGMSTGFAILDERIDGLIDGTLFVLAARKKMGKSTVLTNMAIHSAYVQRKPTLYVDTELTYNEWRFRALACLSGVKERDIKHGNYSEEDYQKLKKAATIIKRGKLFHEYMPGYSPEKLTALYKKYKIKENLKLIVFDYLKEPSGDDSNRKEYQILGDVTTKLKDLAGVLNIPAITAVQMNRSNDIADSDRIARYGDVIVFWEKRTEEELQKGGIDSGTYKMVIKDSRRGGVTNEHGIGYHFFQDKLKIVEVKKEKQYFLDF